MSMIESGMAQAATGLVVQRPRRICSAFIIDKLLWVRLVIGPFLRWLSTVDTGVSLSRPTLNPNPSMCSPVSDIRAFPIGILFARWMAGWFDNQRIAIPRPSLPMDLTPSARHVLLPASLNVTEPHTDTYDRTDCLYKLVEED